MAALNLAITGSNAAAVADAFGEFAEAAEALADAVAAEDGAAVAGGAFAPADVLGSSRYTRHWPPLALGTESST